MDRSIQRWLIWSNYFDIKKIDAKLPGLIIFNKKKLFKRENQTLQPHFPIHFLSQQIDVINRKTYVCIFIRRFSSSLKFEWTMRWASETLTYRGSIFIASCIVNQFDEWIFSFWFDYGKDFWELKTYTPRCKLFPGSNSLLVMKLSSFYLNTSVMIFDSSRELTTVQRHRQDRFITIIK